MLAREVRDFVMAVVAAQRVSGETMAEARAYVQGFGLSAVSDEDFDRALAQVQNPKRGRGRAPSVGVTKGEAIGVVAAYFESIGARPEQAIREAQRWLGVKMARSKAKAAVAAAKHLLPGDQDQRRLLATVMLKKPVWNTTPPQPERFTPETPMGGHRLPECLTPVKRRKSYMIFKGDNKTPEPGEH